MRGKSTNIIPILSKIFNKIHLHTRISLKNVFPIKYFFYFFVHFSHAVLAIDKLNSNKSINNFAEEKNVPVKYVKC